jgi:hypothetical protein
MNNKLSVERRLQFLTLPSAKHLLAEINLPTNWVESLAGKSVRVEVLPEAEGCPMRVQFVESGRTWLIPRRWVCPVSEEPPLDPVYAVTREVEIAEQMILPPFPDLLEINLPEGMAFHLDRALVSVLVRIAPNQPVIVTVRDPLGHTWRIPHDWRRRRIVLPKAAVLIAQGVPRGVAERFGQVIVSVNYHPGSTCCLPDAYRLRDGEGGKWPVKIKDCLLVGFGDEAEHRI